MSNSNRIILVVNIVSGDVIIAATRDLEGKKNYSTYLRSHLSRKMFDGIKIYPALGYYPFDKDLISSYEFAQEYEIPITAHCNIVIENSLTEPIKKGFVVWDEKVKYFVLKDN